MKKNTYYFSHDYNANSDVKILFLRQQLGMEGYGIYWYLIESLADSGGMLPLKIVPVLAMQMQTTEVKVDAVIKQFELFEINEESFYSDRLLQHFNLRNELSLKGKIGALKRWENGGANGGAIIGANGDGNAKERKAKEKKVNEIKLNKEKEIFNFKNELPEQYIQTSIEQVFFIKKIKLDKETVKSLYRSFLASNLDENKNDYKSIDIYKYFVNWLKNQKFETNGKSIAENKIDAYSEWLNRFNQ